MNSERSSVLYLVAISLLSQGLTVTRYVWR